MEKFIRGQFCKNGSSIKHLPNRSVTVITNEISGGIIMEFRRTDLSEDNLQKPGAICKVIKNKISFTGLSISDEAGLALFYALHDYYTRVKNILNEQPCDKHTEQSEV